MQRSVLWSGLFNTFINGNRIDDLFRFIFYNFTEFQKNIKYKEQEKRFKGERGKHRKSKIRGFRQERK